MEDGAMGDPLNIPSAVALLRETAIEMYVEEGHSLQEAQILAKKLLESSAQFKLPNLNDK
jgi:hypothetical protein